MSNRWNNGEEIDKGLYRLYKEKVIKHQETIRMIENYMEKEREYLCQKKQS